MSKTKKSTKSTKSTQPAQRAKPRPGGKQPVARPQIPAVLQTPAFLAAWADWERFHAERGSTLTAENTVRQLELLARLGPDEAVADIRQALAEQVPASTSTLMPESTPTVASPPVENAAPTAEHLMKPTTSTDADSMMPNEVMANEVMANEVMPNEVMPNEVMPNEVMPNEVMPNEVMVSEVVPPAIPTTATTEAEVPVPIPAVLEPAPAAENAPSATPVSLRARGQTPRPAGQLSAIDAAAQVLAAAGHPLTCQQLIDMMAVQGLWSSPKGKTPAGTLYSAILREQAVKGDQARFVKAGRGQFAHRGSV